MPVLSPVLLVAVALVAMGVGALASGTRPEVRVRSTRLDEAGDGWRALLVGAPPMLLLLRTSIR